MFVSSGDVEAGGSEGKGEFEASLLYKSNGVIVGMPPSGCLGALHDNLTWWVSLCKIEFQYLVWPVNYANVSLFTDRAFFILFFVNFENGTLSGSFCVKKTR